MNEYKNTFKPYLINAFYTWAIDTGFTPLIEVEFHQDNQIPESLEDKNPIVFNIHPAATRNLIFSKDFIEFEAKFSNQLQKLSINNKSITRIFSKEDGYGLEFKIFEEINQHNDSPEIEKTSKNPAFSSTKPPKSKKHLILIRNEE